MKRNKKKKAFTLIELVIVLAVLAIIALIAIPNFTKVRNDSMLKADHRSAEQIRKIALMAIANENIADTAKSYDIEFSGKNFSNATNDSGNNSDFDKMLKDVKAPQMSGTGGFTITVEEGGAVKVGYTTSITVNGKNYSTLSE